jgi:hypothetical protein
MVTFELEEDCQVGSNEFDMEVYHGHGFTSAAQASPRICRLTSEFCATATLGAAFMRSVPKQIFLKEFKLSMADPGS